MISDEMEHRVEIQSHRIYKYINDIRYTPPSLSLYFDLHNSLDWKSSTMTTTNE